MYDVTVVILTKNEEEHIVDVINNAHKLTNKVLIVDSGSIDNTVTLAESIGAKVVYRAWDNDFAAQRNFALEYVNTEWIFYLDADERMNDELIKDILKHISENSDRQFSVKRKSMAFGQEFNYGVLKPDFVPRLFKVGSVKWIGKVHENPVCNFNIDVLKGFIKHYTYKDWEQWLRKFDQYTTIWAQNAYEKGSRTKLIYAFGHAFFGFIQMAFLKKGILDGFMGFIMSCNHFFYVLMKYLKLLELQRKGEKI